MKSLLLVLLLYSMLSGQTTIAMAWRPMAGNMQTEYVLRYMEAAQVQRWERMRRAARAATAYCRHKYGERLPYGWRNDFYGW